jgi:hypothetical protein
MEAIMDTALATRTGVESRSSRTCSPAFRYGTCGRCGGLMVSEFCMDLLNSAGELEIETLRCVQCGDVVDPVILQNRLRQQEARFSRGSVDSLSSQFAA